MQDHVKWTGIDDVEDSKIMLSFQKATLSTEDKAEHGRNVGILVGCVTGVVR